MSRPQRFALPTVPRGVSTTVPREAPPAEPVFIGLGANLGQRAEHLRAALAAMDALPGTRVQRVSPLYASAPVDAAGPDYLNAVAELGTALAPEALLAALQSIEQAAGRQRPYHHAPRPLDLDILWFGDRVIATPGLAVPHPRMAGRAFVLRPLADLVPQRIAPAALQAVAGQAIARVQGPDWAAGSFSIEPSKI